MSESVPAIDEATPTRSWFEPAGVAASLAAITTAAVLSYTLLASALDRGWLLWSHTPDRVAGVLAMLWLGSTVAGIVWGLIALLLPAHQHRVRSVIAIALSVLSLLVVPAAAAYALVAWTGPHHPSDEALIEDFRQHEPQFDQAVADLDTGGHIDRSGLRSVGVKVESVARWGGIVRLTVSSYGVVPSGSEKGYAYAERPPYPLTESDTQEYRGEAPDEIVYRHISGPWYLYYEWW